MSVADGFTVESVSCSILVTQFDISSLEAGPFSNRILLGKVVPSSVLLIRTGDAAAMDSLHFRCNTVTAARHFGITPS